MEDLTRAFVVACSYLDGSWGFRLHVNFEIGLVYYQVLVCCLKIASERSCYLVGFYGGYRFSSFLNFYPAILR